MTKLMRSRLVVAAGWLGHRALVALGLAQAQLGGSHRIVERLVEIAEQLRPHGGDFFFQRPVVVLPNIAIEGRHALVFDLRSSWRSLFLYAAMRCGVVSLIFSSTVGSFDGTSREPLLSHSLPWRGQWSRSSWARAN